MTFPPQGFRQVLTKLDAGEADVIVTDDAEAAAWAGANGYRVKAEEQSGETLYEISPGDIGLTPA